MCTCPTNSFCYTLFGWVSVWVIIFRFNIGEDKREHESGSETLTVHRLIIFVAIIGRLQLFLIFNLPFFLKMCVVNFLCRSTNNVAFVGIAGLTMDFHRNMLALFSVYTNCNSSCVCVCVHVHAHVCLCLCVVVVFACFLHFCIGIHQVYDKVFG